MKIFNKLLAVICALTLVACASGVSDIATTRSGAKLDRAKFDAYTFQTLYSDASQVVCDYGKERIADFGTKVPPDHKVWGGGGTHTTRAVYPALKCNWLAADGTPQQEIVKTGKGSFAKYVEWEHFEGERLLEEEPVQLGIVTFTIRIDDKKLTIVRDYRVQLYGERLSETEHHIKAVEVKQVIYERK